MFPILTLIYTVYFSHIILNFDVIFVLVIVHHKYIICEQVYFYCFKVLWWPDLAYPASFLCKAGTPM